MCVLDIGPSPAATSTSAERPLGSLAAKFAYRRALRCNRFTTRTTNCQVMPMTRDAQALQVPREAQP